MSCNARTALTMVAVCLALGIPGASRAGLAPDADGDGIPDVLDKCSLDSRNAAQTCDTDSDGYGNVCDADFDQNYVVNSTDFGTYFVPAFKGGIPSPWPQGQNMDCNTTVSSNDFGSYFIPKFKGFAPGGPVAGPSGLSCAGTPGCS